MWNSALNSAHNSNEKTPEEREEIMKIVAGEERHFARSGGGGSGERGSNLQRFFGFFGRWRFWMKLFLDERKLG